MQIQLLKDERIDNLEYKDLKIIQNRNGFCFGIDSILLSDFAKDIKKGSKVVDLGTGTGIIGMLLCCKTELSQLIGVEIQKEVCEMAKKSIKLNKLNDKFQILQANIKDIDKYLNKESFDAIVTNPPYKKNLTGIQNENEKKLISRHEISATLEDFIKVSSFLLKDHKDIYMVHRPDRLVDIIELLRKYKLEPKKLKIIYPKEEQSPKLILVKATKNAKPFLKIEKPIYIYEKTGEYTKEILKIYGKE